MEQGVITCSAVCSFAPHSQASVNAISFLCIYERNRATSARRRLSLSHAGLGRLISSGVYLASLKTAWSLGAFFATPCFIYIPPSCYTVLHWSIVLHRAALLNRATLCYIVLHWPDRAGLFNSSSAAGTNKYLDLSCCSGLPSGDVILRHRRCSGS